MLTTNVIHIVKTMKNVGKARNVRIWFVKRNAALKEMQLVAKMKYVIDTITMVFVFLEGLVLQPWIARTPKSAAPIVEERGRIFVKLRKFVLPMKIVTSFGFAENIVVHHQQSV